MNTNVKLTPIMRLIKEIRLAKTDADPETQTVLNGVISELKSHLTTERQFAEECFKAGKKRMKTEAFAGAAQVPDFNTFINQYNQQQ